MPVRRARSGRAAAQGHQPRVSQGRQGPARASATLLPPFPQQAERPIATSGLRCTTFGTSLEVCCGISKWKHGQLKVGFYQSTRRSNPFAAWLLVFSAAFSFDFEARPLASSSPALPRTLSPAATSTAVAHRHREIDADENRGR